MKKNVLGIISNGHTGYHVEALKFYDDVIHIDPLKINYIYSREKTEPDILYFDKKLNDLSMLYILTMPPHTKKSVSLLLRALMSTGCPISDSFSRFTEDNMGKGYELSLMQSTYTNTTSLVINSFEEGRKLLSSSLIQPLFPLVTKPIHGSKGNGIHLLKDYSSAEQWLKKYFRQSNNFIILEQFIEFIKEWRVYIVDRHIVASYLKVKKPGEFIANLGYGGGMAKAENMEKVYEFILMNLPSVYDFGIYGVDIALSKQNALHIIEVNRCPGLIGVQALTGVNVQYEANKILFKRARKNRT